MLILFVCLLLGSCSVELAEDEEIYKEYMYELYNRSLYGLDTSNCSLWLSVDPLIPFDSSDCKFYEEGSEKINSLFQGCFYGIRDSVEIDSNKLMFLREKLISSNVTNNKEFADNLDDDKHLVCYFSPISFDSLKEHSVLFYEICLFKEGYLHNLRTFIVYLDKKEEKWDVYDVYLLSRSGKDTVDMPCFSSGYVDKEWCD